MAKSLEILKAEGEILYADPRIFILLDGLLSSKTFTFSGTTLTAASAHKLVLGSRIRFTTTGTLPSPLSANTDYFVKTAPSSTTLTITDVLNGTPITLSAGTGTHTFVEQQLSAEDIVSVLVNHEVQHLDYDRVSLDLSTWAISTTNNDARCERSVTVNPIAPNGNLEYRHIMLIRDGELIEGDITGDRYELVTEPAIIVVAQGTTKNIFVTKSKRNP